MRRGYDSGDGLHPNARGYRRMAAAIPLRLLR
jgi:lysophospholipase L1-like esterase